MENLALGNSRSSLCGTVHERAPLETDVLVVVVVSRGILADAVLHDRLQNVERSALKVSDAAFGLIFS